MLQRPQQVEQVFLLLLAGTYRERECFVHHCVEVGRDQDAVDLDGVRVVGVAGSDGDLHVVDPAREGPLVLDVRLEGVGESHLRTGVADRLVQPVGERRHMSYLRTEVEVRQRSRAAVFQDDLATAGQHHRLLQLVLHQLTEPGAGRELGLVADLRDGGLLGRKAVDLARSGLGQGLLGGLQLQLQAQRPRLVVHLVGEEQLLLAQLHRSVGTGEGDGGAVLAGADRVDEPVQQCGDRYGGAVDFEVELLPATGRVLERAVQRLCGRRGDLELGGGPARRPRPAVAVPVGGPGLSGIRGLGDAGHGPRGLSSLRSRARRPSPVRVRAGGGVCAGNRAASQALRCRGGQTESVAHGGRVGGGDRGAGVGVVPAGGEDVRHVRQHRVGGGVGVGETALQTRRHVDHGADDRGSLGDEPAVGLVAQIMPELLVNDVRLIRRQQPRELPTGINRPPLALVRTR